MIAGLFSSHCDCRICDWKGVRHFWFWNPPTEFERAQQLMANPSGYSFAVTTIAIRDAMMATTKMKRIRGWMRAMQTDRQITEIKSNGIDCLPAIQWHQQNIRWITTDNRIFARVSRIDLCMAREWTAQRQPAPDAKHRSKSRWMAKFIDFVRERSEREPMNQSCLWWLVVELLCNVDHEDEWMNDWLVYYSIEQ